MAQVTRGASAISIRQGHKMLSRHNAEAPDLMNCLAHNLQTL